MIVFREFKVFRISTEQNDICFPPTNPHPRLCLTRPHQIRPLNKRPPRQKPKRPRSPLLPHIQALIRPPNQTLQSSLILTPQNKTVIPPHKYPRFITNLVIIDPGTGVDIAFISHPNILRREMQRSGGEKHHGALSPDHSLREGEEQF